MANPRDDSQVDKDNSDRYTQRKLKFTDKEGNGMTDAPRGVIAGVRAPLALLANNRQYGSKLTRRLPGLRLFLSQFAGLAICSATPM